MTYKFPCCAHKIWRKYENMMSIRILKWKHVEFMHINFNTKLLPMVFNLTLVLPTQIIMFAAAAAAVLQNLASSRIQLFCTMSWIDKARQHWIHTWSVCILVWLCLVKVSTSRSEPCKYYWGSKDNNNQGAKHSTLTRDHVYRINSYFLFRAAKEPPQ